MKNAFQIFKTDLINIFKNPAAIIVIAAVAFLPSLYAWLNIAASWDPYANTEGVTVAIVSEDEGAEVRGEFIDVGDEVINSLKKNDNLGWRFVSKEKAIKGVEHGDYYAAIIIPTNFTDKLLSVTTDTLEKPELDYYINEKVNAISPKVTNSGATAIVENIHNHFVEEVNRSIMQVFNDLGLELEANYVNIEKIREGVFLLEEEMPYLAEQIKKADESLDLVDQSIIKVEDALVKVEEVDEKALEVNEDLLKKLDVHETHIDNTLNEVIDYLSSGQEIFEELPDLTDKNIDLEGFMKDLNDRKNGIKEITGQIEEIQDFIKAQDGALKDAAKLAEIKTSLENNIADLNELKADLEDLLAESEHTAERNDATAVELDQQVKKMQADMQIVFDETEAEVIAAIELAENTPDVAESTVSSLKNIQTAIQDAEADFNTATEKALEEFGENAGESTAASSKQIQKMIDQVEQNIKFLETILSGIEQLESMINDEFINQELKRMDEIKGNLAATIDSVDSITDRLSGLHENSDEMIAFVEDKIAEINKGAEDVITYVDGELRTKFKDIAAQVRATLQETERVFNEIHEKLPLVKEAIGKGKGLTHEGQEKLALVNEHFPEAEDVIGKLADKIRELEGKGNLDELISLLKNDPVKVSQFLADPIILDEHRLYPIPNYGSAMNPFYTTLALWVGGLILVSSLKVDVNRKERFRSHEAYLGRLFTFGSIAIVQAFIVTIGDLFIMKTYVANPFSFIMLGIFISVAFITMIYTLVSVFGNTGKVIAIILMVMQLGGSGGTFPVQMAPAFFQKIHAFLPFTHAITLLREAVGGIIWEIVLWRILYLLIYIIIFVLLGVFLKEFFNKSSDKFMEKAKKSKIVI